MGSSGKISFQYQRLTHEGWFDDDDDDRIRENVIGGNGKNYDWFSNPRKGVHVKKRLKLRIPSLRRFFRRRARLIISGWRKVLKRLKESKSNLGDLFAGNYLFMQITPTPFKPVFDKDHDYCSSTQAATIL